MENNILIVNLSLHGREGQPFLLDQKGRKNQGSLKALPFGHRSKKQPALRAMLAAFCRYAGKRTCAWEV
jgi:hypothetical protein